MLVVRLDAFAEMIGRTVGSRVRVELELEATTARVEVDPTQLEMALLNAAVNARDAMPDGGTLTLSTWDCDLMGQPAVCISITDTGLAAFPPTSSGRVFEPFYTTKDIGKGYRPWPTADPRLCRAGRRPCRDPVQRRTGHDPEDHPAAIRKADVQGGRGTADGVTAARAEGLAGRGQYPTCATLRRTCWKTSIARFVTANDGATALDIINSQPLDLVFSDVVMPGLTGIDTCR
jgi:hypothetical protein